MKAGFAVIGLGRFGRSVARTLTRLGHPVLAIDTTKELVQELATEVEAAVCIDTTDQEALEELELDKFQSVIIGIGEASLESSILTTTLLHQMGVKHIVARAIHDLHARVLLAVGAHEVVNPEAEIGKRVAERIATPSVVDQLDIGDDMRLAEVETPQVFVGRSLSELDVRNRYDLSIVAIKRAGNIIPNPKGGEVVEKLDILVVIGNPSAVRRLASKV
jgi:trk system potassium uptake protein TrkA